MVVTLYKNNSANEVINKQLTVISAFQAKPTRPCDILQPTLILSGDVNINAINANYFYVDLFARYYYIDSYTIDSANRIVITGSVDVLKTYAQQILASTQHIIRQQEIGVNFVEDTALPLESERDVKVFKFPQNRAIENSGFTADTKCFLLTVAGGGYNGG